MPEMLPRSFPLTPPLGSAAVRSPMTSTLLVLAVVLLLAALALLVALLVRPARVNLAEVEARLAAVEAGHARIERALRTDGAGRAEFSQRARTARRGGRRVASSAIR